MTEQLTTSTSIAILAAYYAVLLPLALLGAHRLMLTVSSRRHEQGAAPAAPVEWPVVTVQLPFYNERRVATRLLRAVCAFDYPPERLQIQILDDSTDETTELLRAEAEAQRRRGLDIQLLHRRRRTGYKAGALARGLEQARGDLVAIFDADFVPPKSFLRDAVPHFAQPEIGMVQARWDHLNRDRSLLTRIQALLLDAHFEIEHAARCASGRFFNFNGTAGIWRRACIESAGGWQHDTLTEDLDLSYRAQLAGWRFLYLPAVRAPAELPERIDAFRGQQRRWTRGSVQTLRKLLPSLLRAPIGLGRKLEAIAHLGANLSYPLMVALAVLLLPAMWIRKDTGFWNLLWLDLPILLGATGSVVLFFTEASARDGRSRWRALALQPALMALGIGMSLHNARAALGGLVCRGGVFERTPKSGTTAAAPEPEPLEPYRPASSGRMIWETAMALYLALGLLVAVGYRIWWAVPFLALFLSGYGYVLAHAWRERRKRAFGRDSRSRPQPLDVAA